MRARLILIASFGVVAIASIARAFAADLPDPAKPLPFYDAATAGGHGNFNTTWKGFPKCWQDRQKEFAAKAAGQKGSIVFFGDSITQHCPLETLFPGKPIANRGISGDTSRGMLFRVGHDVIALQPRAVVILCGANDFAQPDYNPDGTSLNIVEMAETIHQAYPSIRIAVLMTMPSKQATAAGISVEDLNRKVRAAIGKLGYVTHVDTHTPFLTSDRKQNAALFKDGVHPNAEGYRIYQEIMTPVLEKLGS